MSWIKVGLLTLLFALTALLIGFFYTYHLPKIKSWLLFEIEEESRRQLPIKLSAKSIELSFIPIGVRLHKVKITPNKELERKLEPTIVDHIDIYPSLHSLLKQKINFKQVKLVGGSLRYTQLKKTNLYDRTKKPDQDKEQGEAREKRQRGEVLSDIAKRINFELLPQFIIHRLTFEEIDLYASSEDGILTIEALNLDVNIISKSLLILIKTPSLTLKEGSRPPLDLDVFLSMRLSENQIQFISSEIKQGNGSVQVQGVINGDLNPLKYHSLELKAHGNLNLGEVRNLAQKLLLLEKIPQLEGESHFQIKVKHRRLQEPQLNVNLTSEGTYIDGREIGQVKIKGKTNTLGFEASLFEIQSSGVRSNIKGFKVQFKDSYDFSGVLNVSGLNINNLLRSLKVEDIPLDVTLEGDLSCQGKVRPQFEFQCSEVQFKAPRLHVFNKKNRKQNGVKKTIVDIKNIYGEKGAIAVNEDGVTYKSEVGFPTAKGTVDVFVSFQENKDFNIKYNMKIKDLLKVDDLVNLNLKGSAIVSGSVRGNKKLSTLVKARIRGNRFSLQNWLLESPEINLEYQKGKLISRRLRGHIDGSRYQGNLSIYFRQKKILLGLDFPSFQGRSINKFLKTKFKMKTQFSGIGNLSFLLHGNLNHPKYKVESSFGGSLFGEKFDFFTFNISGQGNHIKSNKVLISKVNGKLELTGSLYEDAQKKGTQSNLLLKGKNIALEDLDVFKDLNSKIKGQLNFTTKFTGPIKNANIDVHGEITQSSIGFVPIENSNIQVTMNQNQIFGDIRLMGKSVESKFNLHTDYKGPFSLSLKTEKWDFIRFLSLFITSPEKYSFASTITSQLKLTSKSGDPKKSDGYGVISQLEIQRGSKAINSKQPIELIFEEGGLDIKGFRVADSESFLEIESNQSTYDNVNISLRSQMDLGLAILLTPTLDKLQGKISLATQLFGPLNKIQAQGSAHIEGAVLQPRGLPHAIEDLSGHISFNPSQVSLNGFRGQFAGGSLKSSGTAYFKGGNHIPVNLKAEFKNISLQIPKGIQTHGHVQVQLKGERLPYKLSGKYNILSGSVSKDLSSFAKKSDRKKNTLDTAFTGY